MRLINCDPDNSLMQIYYISINLVIPSFQVSNNKFKQHFNKFDVRLTPIHEIPKIPITLVLISNFID